MATPTTRIGLRSVMFVVMTVIIVISGGLLLFTSNKSEGSAKGKDVAAASVKPRVIYVTPQPVVSKTTPIVLTGIDYPWNIESDGPVRIKMPGVQEPVEYVPGKCIKFPEPQMGAYTFWSPSDSAGGHVHFRLYHTNRGVECTE